MSNSNQFSWNRSFSHIYVEKGAMSNYQTQKILSHFSAAIVVEIEHYKDVFSKKGQMLLAQKIVLS